MQSDAKIRNRLLYLEYRYESVLSIPNFWSICFMENVSLPPPEVAWPLDVYRLHPNHHLHSRATVGVNRVRL